MVRSTDELMTDDGKKVSMWRSQHLHVLLRNSLHLGAARLFSIESCVECTYWTDELLLIIYLSICIDLSASRMVSEKSESTRKDQSARRSFGAGNYLRDGLGAVSGR